MSSAMAGGRNVAPARRMVTNVDMSNPRARVLACLESQIGKLSLKALTCCGGSLIKLCPYSSASLLEARVADLEKLLQNARPSESASERSVCFNGTYCL